MEFREKARLRIEHWMKQSADHVREYSKFADELENSGYSDAADNIREIATITSKCDHCLKNALLSVQKA